MRRPGARGGSLIDYAILTATVAASMLLLVLLVRFFAYSCMVESPERFCAPFVGQGPLSYLPGLLSLILLVGPAFAMGKFLSFRREQQRPKDYPEALLGLQGDQEQESFSSESDWGVFRGQLLASIMGSAVILVAILAGFLIAIVAAILFIR